MKTRRIIILLAALSCMMGCVRQLESADQTGDSVVFKAVNGDNPETKTVLQTDGSIVWSAADEINLFYGSGHSTKFTSTNTNPASEVDFRGSLDGFAYNDTDLFWATYPYNAANQCDGNSVTVTLPAEQTAVAGTFADDLFIGVARTKDFNLRFYNVCGGVKFSVTAEGVRSVVFKGKNGEVLAGTAKVVFGEDGKPSVGNVTNPKTEIKVSAPEGSSFEVGKWYYLVSLPVSLQNGFFFTLEKPNGSTATKEYGKTVAVKRSIWGVLKDSDGALEYSEIDADQTLYEVSAAGGPVELAVQTNVETEVTVNVEWMHYMETKTLSSKTVVLSVDRNESTASREGTVTIKQQNSSLRQTITVRQAGWIAVTSVSLDQTSLTLQAEETATLVATVKPDDATDKTVTWTSSAPEIATVDESGKVTAVKDGSATIKAKAGGKTAECKVTVHTSVYVSNAVDLGIIVTKNGTTYKLLWADCNLGTDKPEGFGDYYAWGETETKSDYSWSTYKWANGAYNKLSKYCPTGKADYWDGSGSPDGKTELAPEDDVAQVSLGGKWRLPTDADWTELRNNCTWTWTTQSGVKGRLVTSKKNGNSIFLPAAGLQYGTSLNYVGSEGYYWSSSLSTDYPNYAWYVKFYSDDVNRYIYYRFCGQPVRPVMQMEVTLVTLITLNKSSLELNVGETETLVATVKPDNATDKTVTWTSSNPEIASVDENGKVTAVKSGKATITAKAEEKTAECKVTVNIAVTSVELNKTALALLVGESEALTATVKPDNATDKTVTWSSSDEKIATVQGGKVTAVNVGEATITAKAGDKTAECKVTVNFVPVTSITLNKPSLELIVGETERLVATVKPDNATNKTVTWVSSNLEIASVDENGKVTAVKEGTATITAKAGDITAECKVTVSFIAVTSIELYYSNLELGVGSTANIVAFVEPSDATYKTVTWTSSDSGIVIVDENGNVTAIKVGSAIVTAKAEEYSADCVVTVYPVPDGAVDLGIFMTRADGSSYPLFWAKCNIGASRPEEFGDYYAWGETETKSDYSWDTYKWTNDASSSTLTKYCVETYSWGGDGSPDGKTELDPEDDVAHVKLGGKWRMPTMEEQSALRLQCEWTWKNRNGIKGYEVKSKVNTNSIFLPAAGWLGGIPPYGIKGAYWSSSLVGEVSSGYAYGLYFEEGNGSWWQVYRNYDGRCLGFSIRPVTE